MQSRYGTFTLGVLVVAGLLSLCQPAAAQPGGLGGFGPRRGGEEAARPSRPPANQDPDAWEEPAGSPPPNDRGGPPPHDGRGMGPGPHGPGGPGRGMGGPGMGRHGGPPPGHPRFRDDWSTLEQRDPEMYALITQDQELERGSLELAQLYRVAAEDAKEAIQRELHEVVSEHFKVRQQRRELELERLEEQLTRLKKQINVRNENADRIVQKRIGELTGQRDPLEF